MRLLFFSFSLALASPAFSDCRAEIAALYNGGAMDEFTRRPHHIEMTDYAADGTMTERHVGQQIDGTHYTLFSEVRGMGVLYVGTEVWYQMGKDAAWGNKQTMPAVRKDDLMRQQAEKAACISEDECLGAMQADGQEYVVYRWRVFTDTSEEHGGWHQRRGARGLGRPGQWRVGDPEGFRGGDTVESRAGRIYPGDALSLRRQHRDYPARGVGRASLVVRVETVGVFPSPPFSDPIPRSIFGVFLVH